ncbi:FISUMP domain-containing protein [Fibrobacter sp. UWB10]|uniref:FISUMP domain-containing protein n=1 Tax=Fibrobacter sp. UWB10 TaxID=1896201 RepID=UPI002403225C|nr:FISUMP domain-containing protein [Fibrobacter sp. UWB10]SMP48435.1 major paralogous domain-containing protein [Fibrobacter sp. UWB10]
MKIFANALALSILLALLAACGDESSSSVSPEPRQCEEQGDDCDDVSSSSEKISKNSSSSQKSADKGKSSSSEKNAKESSSSAATVKNSSSSAGDNKSSSSIKKEDSSSSVEIASSSSVTPKSSSSEEVKQSSSSAVASSSSVKSSSSVSPKSSSSETYQHWYPLNGDLKDMYAKFIDSRDNREYYYIQITGKDTAGKAASIKVMAENLNVGEFVWGFEDQEDDSKIERYCYKNDTANCNKYGGLYQWAEMMQLPSRCNTESCADLIKPNHQGICPDGWRLLTYNDYYIVVHADNNEDGVKGTRSTYGFGGSNDSGYSLIGAGYLWDHTSSNVGETTYWYYPAESSNDGELFVYASAQSRSSTGNPKYEVYKTHGFSVRCVMVE